MSEEICTICNKSFVSRKYYRRHMRKYHPLVWENERIPNLSHEAWNKGQTIATNKSVKAQNDSYKITMSKRRSENNGRCYTYIEKPNTRKPGAKMNGYKYTYIPDANIPGKGINLTEHVLIMETVLGRKLKKGECVHHKDGNRSNNAVENLLLLKSIGDHTRLHSFQKSKKPFVLLQCEDGAWECKGV